MNRLHDKTALVTGGAQGIGRAIAARFTAEGANVAVLDIKKAECDGCVVIQADISHPPEISFTVDRLLSQWGRVDILVNNAGIFDETPVTELAESRWDQVCDINLKAQFLFAKAVVPQMKAKGWGRIINLSSMAGKVAYSNEIAYCATKSGVLGLTRALGVELGPAGITVNAICPGPIETEMLRNTYQHLADQHGVTLAAWQADILQTIPVRRYGRPADIAALAAFLASEEAGFINAQGINIDGGMVFY